MNYPVLFHSTFYSLFHTFHFTHVTLIISDEVTGHVDHNVLRHLNIERDTDQYKKFEYPNPGGLAEKLQKNIENLQTMPVMHEAIPVPNLEEKANIREKMFNFLDEARMEETRLVTFLLFRML